MNRVFRFSSDAKNNQCHDGNRRKSTVVVPDHHTPSLIQGMMGSIPSPKWETQRMMQSLAFVSDPMKQPMPNPPDAVTHTTEQLFELFGNDIPTTSDAFEPTPMRENSEISTPTLSNVMLGSVLEAALDGVNTAHSFSDATEASDPFKVFDDDHQNNPFHSGPVATDDGSGIFAPAHEASPFTVGSIKSEADSLPNILRISTSAPIPKRRRMSYDGQPSFHRYHEIQWMEQFEELVKFKDQKGHCLVPHTYPENQILSRWVKRQRYQYKLKMAGKSSTMTDERMKKLDDIGFVWSSHETTWYKRLEELKQYADKHGDCDIPMNYPENQELATWVKCQRRQYKLFLSCNHHSSMTLDRMQALRELGFVGTSARKSPFRPLESKR